MISSAADYKFVTGANIAATHPHGDLDRITIDGSILPLRTGDARKHLRGEDIAFLVEAARERYALLSLWSAEPQSCYDSFSRMISANQMAWAIYRVQSTLFYHTHDSSLCWINPEYQFVNKIYSGEGVNRSWNYRDEYADSIIPTSSFTTWNTTVPTPGDKIELQPIADCYDDLALEKRGVHYLDTISSSHYVHTFTDVVDQPDPDLPPSFMSFVGIFWYDMDALSNGGRYWDRSPFYSRFARATNVDISFTSPFVASAIALVGFRVVYQSHDCDRTIHYVIRVLPMTKVDNTFTVSSARLIAEAEEVVAELGYIYRPIPARSETADPSWQEIVVDFTNVEAVVTLRDRTRW